MTNDNGERDPVNNPIVGDILRQPGGAQIKVTFSDDSRVEWVEIKRRGAGSSNGWTLKAWREIVAQGATIIQRAEEGEAP